MLPENEKVGSFTSKSVSQSVPPGLDEETAAGPSLRTLHRQMKNRHIAMISIGGVIGTGLFLGTASALQAAGPVGMLLAYIVVGSLCYTVMISLGEMAALLPLPGGHLTFAERFVDPALSFALGWLYCKCLFPCYNWTIILPAELSAASVVISYWNKTVNPGVWITMCLVVVLAINVFGAGVYGEAEFIFASIKVITITGLLILGIILDLGGGPNHDRIGFRYWKHPGPFAQFDDIPGTKGQFLGFAAVMVQAAFTFIGTEVVAIAGAEVKNPLRNIPKAIRNVYIRLLLFYIGGVAVIGLLVPYTDSRLNIADGTAAASPFVIAINNAGIKVLPSIINAVVLTSAWSAGNSQLYVSSRALYGLALNGKAPKIFLKVTRHGLPWVAFCATASFASLAYMSIGKGSGRVFGWFVNMCAVAGLSSWLGIAITYVRFYRGLQAKGIERKSLPYRSPLQPFAAWYALVGCAVAILFSGWSVFLQGHWRTDTFLTNYFPIAAFCVLYAGAKLWTRKPLVPYAEMDFESGFQEVLCLSHDEPPPRNWVERVWRWLGTTLEDVFHQQLGYPLWSATPVDKDPEVIISSHLAFLRSGADIVTTSTYQAAYHTYEIAGYSREDAKRLMLESVRLAIEAKRRYLQEITQDPEEGWSNARPPRSVKIALSLGPYGGMLSPAQEFDGFYPPPFGPPLSHTDKMNIFVDTDDGRDQEGAATEALANFHYERLEVFAGNKETWDEIDFIAFETVPLRREIIGIRRAVAKLEKARGMDPAVGQRGEHGAEQMKPWWISTVHPDGHYPEKMLGGGWVTMAEVAGAALLGEDEGASIPWGFGINCTSVEFLPKLLREAGNAARQAWELHGVRPWLILYPNGGDVYNAETHLWEAKGRDKSEWAKGLSAVAVECGRAEAWGGMVVGGCCKTGPDDISELRKWVTKLP